MFVSRTPEVGCSKAGLSFFLTFPNYSYVIKLRRRESIFVKESEGNDRHTLLGPSFIVAPSPRHILRIADAPRSFCTILPAAS